MIDHVSLLLSDYGAFVLDPDGNNVEAVCQEAP
jgi:hypothetical protein